MNVVWIVIPLFILVAIGRRIVVGGWDHSRVKDYVESRGGQVIEIKWSPFGPGWFGGGNNRIYAVRYLDHDGNEHQSYCKTSMWTGVYFAQDQIVSYADQANQTRISLEEENRRLRDELSRVKHEHGLRDE